jgi:hypothetical protein
MHEIISSSTRSIDIAGREGDRHCKYSGGVLLFYNGTYSEGLKQSGAGQRLGGGPQEYECYFKVGIIRHIIRVFLSIA